MATTLNELAKQSRVSIRIDEKKVSVREVVLAACEIPGLDPLYVANEGRLVAIVPTEDADKVLEALRRNHYGKDASLIGEVSVKIPEEW